LPSLYVFDDGRGKSAGEQFDGDGLAAAAERLCDGRRPRDKPAGSRRTDDGFQSAHTELDDRCSFELQIQAAVQLHASDNGSDQQHGQQAHVSVGDLSVDTRQLPVLQNSPARLEGRPHVAQNTQSCRQTWR